MKSLLIAVCTLAFTIGLAGCGGGKAAPATDEEKAKLDAQMQDDMKKMQGLVPKKPQTQKKN